MLFDIAVKDKVKKEVASSDPNVGAQDACGERSRIIEPLYSQELLEIIPDEGKMLLVDYLTIHYYPKQQLILYWRLKRDALHTSVQGVF